MDVVAVIAGLGGVARVRTVLAAGASRYDIACSVREGAVIRVRNGWVALPQTAPELLDAVRMGGVVTCVSEAKNLGLWVLREERLHLAVGSHSGRVRAPEAVVHWGKPLVPRDPNALRDSLENMLDSVAQCQPYEAALVVWESALRKGLVSREVLARLALSVRARHVLESAGRFSDSGLETIVASPLKWLNLPIVPQAYVLGHRVDFLIGERLVLQIDGGHHVGRQREEDIAHDALLMLEGFHTIRAGYGQVIQKWPAVQGTITRAIGQGLHLASSERRRSANWR